MEHPGYHVDGLLEQAAKNELNYREFPCIALQKEWNDRHKRGMEIRLKQSRFPWIKNLEQSDFRLGSTTYSSPFAVTAQITPGSGSQHFFKHGDKCSD